jgi:argininosuccinate lyase
VGVGCGPGGPPHFMKLWGGRFETGPSEIFERFSGSLHFDRRLLDADCRGSAAFARALQQVGIVTAEEGSTLVGAFEQIRVDARQPGFFDGATDEDVHTLVIRKLKERVGELADKIHTGRSRNEQVSLDIRLWLREQIDSIVHQLGLTMSALVAMGRKYPDALVTICWPISKCSRAIGSAWCRRGRAST